MARRNNRAIPSSPARRAGVILYRILVVLSAVIVVLFIAYRLAARRPDMASEPAPPVSADSTVSGGVESPEQPARSRREATWTFLLAASDQVGGGADTIMVCTYDTVNQKAGLVSIPRDTLVEQGKINSLYNGGVETLKAAVSNMLGIPIDYYITVNIRGFVEVIDAVDGIDFNVPVHMSYDAPDQDLHIHFEPGLQHLSGSDALKVARCRKNSDGPGSYPDNIYDAYPDADIGRTRTQQQLVAAVVKKVLSRPDKIPQVVGTMMEHVDTDLSLSNILWLAEPALGLDFSADLSTATLEGDGNVSYRHNGYNWGSYCYELYPEQALETVNALLNPYDQPLTLEDMNIFQVD